VKRGDLLRHLRQHGCHLKREVELGQLNSSQTVPGPSFKNCGDGRWGTDCADAPVTTLRACLLELAVWVEQSVRWIVVHFPMTLPWRETWRRASLAVGAT
jgi:hypothetical protein